MTADLTVTCGYCGGDDLACRSCDDTPPTDTDPAWHAVIDPRVRDSIMRTRCPCETARDSGHWLLCAWHQGYAAAFETTDKKPPDVTEVEELRAWKRDATRVLAVWETVWEALDRPGPLGTSKAAACAAAVRRPTQEAAR